MDPKRNHSEGAKSGQAMSEFLVGLVSIMLLVVGLQQISIISERSFEAHVNMRRQLAEQMVDPSGDYSGEFVFADPTDVGPDEKPYTADDRIMVGEDAFYEEGQGFFHGVDYDLLEGYLSDYDLTDPYYRLSDSQFAELSKSLQMFYAEDAQPVEIVPFLRRVFGRDLITIHQSGWMPALDKLNE